MINQPPSLQLGCGLIRIGRIWGPTSPPVPSETEVAEFLEAAYQFGIRFFDTAPSYGLSEKRLGNFIKRLSLDQQKEIFIATKFGEHWDKETQQPFVDHSYKALMVSLEHSLALLGKIDLLQLHKSSTALLKNPDITHAFETALKMGIPNLGVSVSDMKTGLLAAQDNRFNYIQLPYNQINKDLLPVIHAANEHKKQLIFNRPFATGKSVTDDPEDMIQAFRFLVNTYSSGIVLTGTASIPHLKENLIYFEEATT